MFLLRITIYFCAIELLRNDLEMKINAWPDAYNILKYWRLSQEDQKFKVRLS